MARRRPTAPTAPAAAEVPVIDLAALTLANTEGGGAVDELLDRAFGPDGPGILCVAGDGAFQAAVRRIRGELLPQALALERLPQSEQEAITERGTVNVNNYSRRLDGHRSGIYFHPASDTPADCVPPGFDADPTWYPPNLWPASLPELRAQARSAASLLVDVGRQVAAALDRRFAAEWTGYRPGALTSLVREPEQCNHKCRLICYPEYGSEEERARAKGMWAPPHKDTGLLTALVPGVFLDTRSGADGARLPAPPDPEVGLYVRDRRGAILQVATPPEAGDCLLFQAGEALQIVSGGLYHATEHCVRGPPRACAGYARASMAVFFQPHAHEELPLPEGVDLRDVAARAYDGLFRMYLLHQASSHKRSLNFLDFCLREGF